MKKQLFANPDHCTGCNRCALICSALKEGAFQPDKARIRINNFPLRGYSVPSICFQCPKANCMDVCPSSALYRDADGVVLVNENLCTACGTCVSACPYGMMEQGAAGIAYKCDCCGGDPACVRECHADALLYAVGDSEQIRLKGAQMKYRTAVGTPAEKRHVMAEKLMKKARS
ncbi:MAG: 4Fe-4S dicluster domain-containing protein [Desulfuromonadaceae bacterium]|nr:4Fe-4S dicluster domain-containing protein [Desulfuromonadaceae bacterium]MDD5105112.1 4Fe-4S dicluster domain-containing protein [Desulfuromonadaceae bacterium]